MGTTLQKRSIFLQGPLALCPRAAVLGSHCVGAVFAKDRRSGCPFWNMLLFLQTIEQPGALLRPQGIDGVLSRGLSCRIDPE